MLGWDKLSRLSWMGCMEVRFNLAQTVSANKRWRSIIQFVNTHFHLSMNQLDCVCFEASRFDRLLGCMSTLFEFEFLHATVLYCTVLKCRIPTGRTDQIRTSHAVEFVYINRDNRWVTTYTNSPLFVVPLMVTRRIGPGCTYLSGPQSSVVGCEVEKNVGWRSQQKNQPFTRD